MNAFFEYLAADIAIIRAGPGTVKWGDPYELACVVIFHEDTKEAEFKALVSDGRTKAAHVKAAIKLCQGLGYKVYWERVKSPDEIRHIHR